MENLIFDGTSGLKLEMTSYPDNAYDVTNLFLVLKSSWPILYSYKVSLLSDTKWQSKAGGGGLTFCSSPSIIGVSRTPSKIGLNCQFSYQLPSICLLASITYDGVKIISK